MGEDPLLTVADQPDVEGGAVVVELAGSGAVVVVDEMVVVEVVDPGPGSVVVVE